MNGFVEVVTIFCLAMPVYVYLGYPLLLLLFCQLVPRRQTHFTDMEPSVTLVVSYHNEEDVIEEKIKNCLALYYPSEKFEILFVSDASEDRSDEIVASYLDRGVRLIRQQQRQGKTSGLNAAVPQARGELIIFSDANAIYDRNAVSELVKHFVDPAVGYVVGAALYRDSNSSSAASSESGYWSYELLLKSCESKLSSVVGGDGAIYAARKCLYETLDSRDINDFVNPLQICAKGYRGVFEPAAICYEDTAGSFSEEGARKERIVNRSFRGLMSVKEVLNPFRFGIFSWQVVSHKLLRWLVPFFLLIAVPGALYLSSQQLMTFQFISGGILVVCVSALLGYLLSLAGTGNRFLSLPYYFVLVNYYSLRGVCRSVLGSIQVTWNSSRAVDPKENRKGVVRVVSVAVSLIVLLSFRLYVDVVV